MSLSIRPGVEGTGPNLTAAQRISVVDDDMSVCKSMRRLFESLGYAVETYASAEEFLQAGAADRADCLVLDVHLGGASGLELQSTLRAAQKSVPIVFITSHADDEQTREQALAAGASDFLRKLADGERLLEAVERALQDMQGET